MEPLRLKYGDVIHFDIGTRGCTLRARSSRDVHEAHLTFAGPSEIKELEERLATIRARLEKAR